MLTLFQAVPPGTSHCQASLRLAQIALSLEILFELPNILDNEDFLLQWNLQSWIDCSIVFECLMQLHTLHVCPIGVFLEVLISKHLHSAILPRTVLADNIPRLTVFIERVVPDSSKVASLTHPPKRVFLRLMYDGHSIASLMHSHQTTATFQHRLIRRIADRTVDVSVDGGSFHTK